jgi:hypothetical protein
MIDTRNVRSLRKTGPRAKRDIGVLSNYNEYSEEQSEFLIECARYREARGVRALSLSDCLEVLKLMGYTRTQPNPPAQPQNDG